jgi:aspartate kinase
VTGFIGATAAGATTTLGRGGSDYSGAIVGAALDADEVAIYTDVDGVMTTDPRLAPDARVIPVISYAEMGELAYFGAKVLHPRTIRPVVERDIPLRIRNTFNPAHPGTLVVSQPEPSGRAVKAVTSIKGMSVITVEGRGMIGVPGVAARTFGAVASVGANVLMISQASSEQSICFVVPQIASAAVCRALEEGLANELARRDVDRIAALDGVVIVTAVGAGMRDTPGVAAQVFGSLAERRINVVAIAQGSSECSISLVVAGGDADAGVRAIHALTI